MSFGMIPLSPDDKPDSFVLLSMYEKLESENAKLREDLEDQEGYDQILRDRLRQQTELCVKAEAENAKLRELVADMWPFVEGAMDDEYCPAPKCPFTELCTENQVCMASSGFYYRMRELEVEVDDGD